MLDAKQLKNLWSYPSIQRPIDYTIQASWASTFRDCYIGDAGGSTDGYFVGNMGGGAFFTLLVFDIPETKSYNIEVRYAYGDDTITSNTIEVYNLTSGSNVNLNITSDLNWGNYRIIQSTLTLNKGVNRIRIRRSGAQGFNTDYLRIWETSYGEYFGTGKNWYLEKLNVTVENTISDLSKTPASPDKVLLSINGQIQDAIAPGAAFTVTGKAIALTGNMGFPILPGSRVIAFYETEE